MKKVTSEVKLQILSLLVNVKRKESKKDVRSGINISMGIQSVDQSFDIVHIDRKKKKKKKKPQFSYKNCGFDFYYKTF